MKILYLFGLLYLTFLTSCVATSHINNSHPMEVGEEKYSVSGGFFKTTNSSEKTNVFPLIQISHQEKLDDDISFELYYLGGKIIEDIYNGSGFYISTFQSLYFALVGIGGNIGILFSSTSELSTLYFVGKFDNILTVPTEDGDETIDGFYFILSPALGISFDFSKTKRLFFEIAFSIPIYESKIHEIYSYFTIFTQIGLSF